MAEIFEQPEAVARALNYGGRIHGEDNAKLGGLLENERSLVGVKHLIIAACGTSLYAGLFGAHLMRIMNSFETVQGTSHLTVRFYFSFSILVIDAAEIDDQNFINCHDGVS